MLQYLIIYLSMYPVIILISWCRYKLNIREFLSEDGKNNKWIFYVLSFTLLNADICKFKKEGSDKSDIIREFNSFYLAITSTISFSLIFFGLINEPMSFVYKIKELFPNFSCLLLINKIGCWLLIAFGFYAFSRVNEIFIAFIRDAQEQLSKPYDKYGVKYHKRILLAMKSYIELILLYGILQFLLSLGVFDELLNYDFIPLTLYKGHLNSNNAIDTAWEAIYFSGITIATIGYGDLTPKSGISQFLAIYEVINGITLLVVSFTIYVSRSIDEKECGKDESSDDAIKKIDENIQKCREAFEEIERQTVIVEKQRKKQKEFLKEAINNLQSTLKNLE